jgi:hypothetical protein
MVLASHPSPNGRNEPMMELDAVFSVHLAHERHERERDELAARRVAARALLAARGPEPDTYAADHPWRDAA